MMAPLPFVPPTNAEMDQLQDAAVISDCCVSWDDVADDDKPRALRCLEIIRARKDGAA